MKIRVAEVFESFSGEVGGFPQGSPCTFVRLAGCSLQCPFCDTKQFQSHDSGTKRDVKELVHHDIVTRPWRQILITGGEPMEQATALQALVNEIKYNYTGYRIQVETNGSLAISNMAMVDYWVVDLKGADAMQDIPYRFNPDFISPNMWIKCLVASMDDLDSAIGFIKTMHRTFGGNMLPKFAISTVGGIKSDLTWQIVADNIIEVGLPISLNMQIHKFFGIQ